jgi:glycerate 2-kinase
VKFVLAPDSFKESMSARQAVDAMRRGILSVLPDAECVGVPMADGGEGTVDTVIDALDGKRIVVDMPGALGRPISARYGYIPDRRLAVVEISAAAGIELILPEDRDVLRASTFGVGLIVRSALDHGATDILIGLGGSATNDGGTGMLTALGAQFVDESGGCLPPGGAALARLHRIELSELDPRIRHTRIRLACDVTAPLLGPRGASAVFGPQKGATAADVAQLESALTQLAAVTSATLGYGEPLRAGAGAAGGLGFALLEYFDAEARPGVEVVVETVGLEHQPTEARVGNYVTDNPSNLGKYVTADTPYAAQPGSTLLPLSYELAGASVASLRGSQNLEATMGRRPNDHAMSQAISAVAPHFVHKSIHKTTHDERALLSLRGRIYSPCDTVALCPSLSQRDLFTCSDSPRSSHSIPALSRDL